MHYEEIECTKIKRMKNWKTTTIASELNFSFVRSGGAGGQNVNKVATKAELSFDVANSNVLSTDEKNVFLAVNSAKINEEGIFKFSVDKTRSQLSNKELAIEKFYAILTKTFTPRKTRKKTAPTEASKLQKRIEKERNSKIKANRQKKGNNLDE